MKRRSALAALGGSCLPLRLGAAVAGQAPAASVLAWSSRTCWAGRGGTPLQSLAGDLAAGVPPAPVVGGVWLALDGGVVRLWRPDRDGAWQAGPVHTVGAAVHALAASSDGCWALAAHGEGLTLVDAQGLSTRSYEGADLERRRRGPAQALFASSRRRSFVATWPALGELWEISLDPAAPPIFDGLVHDYRMSEGIAAPGYLGARRAPLGLPMPAICWADPRVSWVAGTLGDAVVIVHLDVRRRIASLPIPGAVPEASLLLALAGTLQWWLPAGEQVHVVDTARWTVLERHDLPAPAIALRSVQEELWALVGDANAAALVALRGGSWLRLRVPPGRPCALGVDPSTPQALLASAGPAALHLLDNDARVLHRWALPDGAAPQGAAWIPAAP